MAAHTWPQIWLTSNTGEIPYAGLWHRVRELLTRRGHGFGAHIVNVRLGAGQHLSLRNAAGWTALCRAGAVWITQESDTRDIFLNANEGYALDRPGLAVISACRHDATLAIRPPAGAAAREFPGNDRGLPPSGDDPSLAWLRALYPESGPWNDRAPSRRSDLS